MATMIKIQGLFGWLWAKVATMRHLFLQQKEQCQRAVGEYNNPHIMSVQGMGKALSASANWAHAAMAGSRPSCTMVLEDQLCDGIKPKMFVHRILKRVGNKITGAAADAESLLAILEGVWNVLGIAVPWGKMHSYNDVLQLAREGVKELGARIFNSGLDLMFEPHPTFSAGNQRRMLVATEGGWKSLPRHYKPAFERYFNMNGSLNRISIQDEANQYSGSVRQQWSSYKTVDKQWLLDRGFDPHPYITAWNTFFQKLLDFQSTYGHMDVHPFYYQLPVTEETRRFKALYDWILKQRLRCTSKEKFAGQSNQSTTNTPRTSEQQRIKVEHEFLLLSIGFSFNMREDSCKLSLYRMLSMINPFLD
ncbi:hypothetical protein MPSEU_000555300 [Mayamaea pseudoterrestris]|nr:hypothetical protein MPSEU_000555300 [Mayamaea pseudoterrestris]